MMNEISNSLLVQRNSSIDEVNQSSPNLNTQADCITIEFFGSQIPKLGGDDTSQSISKSQQAISTPSSVQGNNDQNTNINNDTAINQHDQNCNNDSLSASFKQLSRRESSLENLTEDDIGGQINLLACDKSATYFLQKPDSNDDIRDFTKKSESSSRFRRTIYSLFSCCSTKSRRSTFVAHPDHNVDYKNESETEKCSSHIINNPDDDKSRTRSFNCLRLRKFFDVVDESETVVNRIPHVRQTLLSVPYRDGDRTESPSCKAGDTLQSGNGGSNLTYSDNEFVPIIPESESLLSVAPFYTTRTALLGPIRSFDQGKKCFIIDLDETLVHSSFKMVDKADFKVGVDIEGTVHTVYVLKRPHVDMFLQKMGRIFECVLFTASLAKYADPVTDFLDKWRVFRWRLFRESCVFHRGNYVKDLGMLGRPLDQVAILDNSPASYMFHPDSAVQITSWFDDPRDRALLDLIPYLEQLARAPSVPSFLGSVKPPARATVPVSVMMVPGAHDMITTTTTTQSSSHDLITSVCSQAPSPPLAQPHKQPRDTTAPIHQQPLASIPFSSYRNQHHLQSAYSSSLPSITHSGKVHTHSSCSRHSRSESSLASTKLPSHPLPIITRTALVTMPRHKSRSTTAVKVRGASLTVMEKPKFRSCPALTTLKSSVHPALKSSMNKVLQPFQRPSLPHIEPPIQPTIQRAISIIHYPPVTCTTTRSLSFTPRLPQPTSSPVRSRSYHCHQSPSST